MWQFNIHISQLNKTLQLKDHPKKNKKITDASSAKTKVDGSTHSFDDFSVEPLIDFLWVVLVCVCGGGGPSGFAYTQQHCDVHWPDRRQLSHCRKNEGNSPRNRYLKIASGCSFDRSLWERRLMLHDQLRGWQTDRQTAAYNRHVNTIRFKVVRVNDGGYQGQGRMCSCTWLRPRHRRKL